MAAKTYELNSKKAISESMDGETIVINMESGNYYNINKSGSAIWQAIQNKEAISIEDKDVKRFLDFLVKEELVNETGEAGKAKDDPEFKNPVIDKYEDMQEMLLADPIHDVEEIGWPKIKQKI